MGDGKFGFVEGKETDNDIFDAKNSDREHVKSTQ